MTSCSAPIIDQVESGRCTGCLACVQACPRKCIRAVEDGEGFLVPRVDSRVCIGCGVCGRACHLSKAVEPKSPTGYVALSRSRKQRRTSTSGGVFAATATMVIERGGVAYGAAFDDQWHLVHRRISTLSDLPLLQGSKYLQSDTSDIFSQVRDDLERGLEVLFSGTPCQVAGLCSFLGHGYPGLTTVDLICHGVSSPGLWKHHLRELKKGVRGEITSISFREKTRFEKSAYALVLRRRFSKTVIPSLQDAYYGPYLKGYTLRESCYRCSYASLRRPGDITIGDCATMEDDLRFHPEEMLSTVLVNTPRGREVFAGLAGRLHLLELDVAEEAKKNAQLHAPCVRPPERNRAIGLVMRRDEGALDALGIRPERVGLVRRAVRNLVPVRVRIRVKAALEMMRHGAS